MGYEFGNSDILLSLFSDFDSVDIGSNKIFLVRPLID